MRAVAAADAYLARYRAVRADVARRLPEAAPERIWRASWRLTEIDLGLERQGVPVGPVEG